MTVESLVMLFFGSLATSIAWFIKRDIGRFEKHIEEQSKATIANTTAINSLQVQIATLISIAEWSGHLERFFGEGGGNKRIWVAIEDIRKDNEKLRERDHWFMNKLAIIKGRCEMNGIKFSENESWIIPSWNQREG